MKEQKLASEQANMSFMFFLLNKNSTDFDLLL